MKKYKIAKWIVLGTSIFAVICFFLPFLYDESGGRFNSTLFFGFHFFGSRPYDVATTPTIIAFIMAIAAVILSTISLVFKNAVGLNRRGKIHCTLISSIVLSFLSGLFNFIFITIIDDLAWDSNFKGNRFTGYTYIYFIFIVLAAVAAIVLLVKTKREIPKPVAKPAPIPKPVSPVAAPVKLASGSNKSSPVTAESASAARSQTAQASGNKKVQKNYVEDKPMTKKDAEGLLAYIWVRQYNTLPFDEALDKIMAYLIENKYVMTPETEAAYAASLSTAAGDGNAPAANDKDLRHAREARDSESWEDAKKYYERVRDEYPDLLEARFYYPLCKLMDSMNKDFFQVYTTDFSKQILPLAKTVPQADISVEEQKELALAMLRDLCRMIDRARDVAKVMKDTQGVHIDYRWVTHNMYELGTAFEAAYAGDAELLKEVSLVAFKAALSKIDKVKAYQKDHIDRYVEGIHRYEPDYKYPKLGLVINPFAFYATPKELLNK